MGVRAKGGGEECKVEEDIKNICKWHLKGPIRRSLGYSIKQFCVLCSSYYYGGRQQIGLNVVSKNR